MNHPTFRQAGSALAFAAACLGTATAPAIAADDALHSLIAEQTVAWNRRDAKAWARDFAADAGFINILGMQFHGRQEIEARHAFLFGGIFKESRLAVTVQKVRRLGDNAAAVDTLHELHGYARLPPGIRPTDDSGALRTRMNYILVRSEAGWQIVSAQNTAIISPAP